ncbi:MAG: single-stranded-DNA-specific exonuclease RecJ [Endozoicomonadaceae bacterium]|nr:single-stranded-DNA-specific exonuclease RecJ [Endozoicomonadaceae bacterium]
MPLLLQRIYAGRGVLNDKDLARTLPELHHYEELKGIQAATSILEDAVISQRRILIVGDFDCDGATSSALAVKALRAMGASWVDYLVPNRFEYGYGLTPEIVEVAKASRPDVLVTVDNGISSIPGVKVAKALGMQVVVTDHHQAGHELPDADAIVNPNQPGCPFPGKNTAGVGVIFYVLCALRTTLDQRNWFIDSNTPKPNMADFLDLVALGTIADLVSLDTNNRIFVYQGLVRIQAGRARVGILALIDVAKRRRDTLSATDLGFALGPRLNAAGRLDNMSLGIELLLTDNASQARKIASELDSLNTERKRIESSMRDDAMHELDQLKLDDSHDTAWGLCLFHDSWHQGVVGILASQIKKKLHRPVIVFAVSQEGVLKGSARSIPGLQIRDALDAIASRHPELLLQFGGHAMAAGLTLRRENYDRFSEAFDQEVRRMITEDQLIATVQTDAELTSDHFTLETAELLREAGPWGQNFAEPLFDGCFDVVEQLLVGEKHLKMVLMCPGSDRLIDGIAFNVDTGIWPNASVRKIRSTYTLDINEFRNNRKLQLLIDHLEPAD